MRSFALTLWLALTGPIVIPGLTPPATAQQDRASAADRAALVSALRTLASTGDAEAAYHLGMMRLLGIGGLKDEKAAFELFKQAAEAGDPLGAYKLGDYYARPGNGFVEANKAEALRLKTIAAQAGYSLAQHDVARLHFEAGDVDQALEWLLQAAQQGQADALRALASLYNSDAIAKDPARTYAYYTLYLKRLAEPTDAQKAFIEKFVGSMSDADKGRGDRIVDDWTIEQSDLTRKAQSGLRAADALVKARAMNAKEEKSP